MQLETSLGVQLPAEFKDLYRTCNGVGICRDPSAGASAPTSSVERAAQFEAMFGVAMAETMQEGTDEQDSAVRWFFVPVAKIPELTAVARSWFEETHAEAARRFVAFIDWDCGDYTGYVLPLESGTAAELHTFEHESYQFDEAQEAGEFLLPSYESIREYFLAR